MTRPTLQRSALEAPATKVAGGAGASSVGPPSGPLSGTAEHGSTLNSQLVIDLPGVERPGAQGGMASQMPRTHGQPEGTR